MTYAKYVPLIYCKDTIKNSPHTSGSEDAYNFKKIWKTIGILEGGSEVFEKKFTFFFQNSLYLNQYTLSIAFQGFFILKVWFLNLRKRGVQ